MDYEPGAPQAWRVLDLGAVSAYPTITGAIFEFGFATRSCRCGRRFSTSSRTGSRGCTSRSTARRRTEAAATHRVFTAALESQRERSVVDVGS